MIIYKIPFEKSFENEFISATKKTMLQLFIDRCIIIEQPWKITVEG